jgi:hypothetical protein
LEGATAPYIENFHQEIFAFSEGSISGGFSLLLCLRLGSPALELINHSGCVEGLLGACVERMALRADFNGYMLFCRAKVEYSSACAGHCRLFEVFWVDFSFHSRNTISETFAVCKPLKSCALERIDHICLDLSRFCHDIIAIEGVCRAL